MRANPKVDKNGTVSNKRIAALGSRSKRRVTTEGLAPVLSWFENGSLLLDLLVEHAFAHRDVRTLSFLFLSCKAARDAVRMGADASVALEGEGALPGAPWLSAGLWERISMRAGACICCMQPWGSPWTPCDVKCRRIDDVANGDSFSCFMCSHCYEYTVRIHRGEDDCFEIVHSENQSFLALKAKGRLANRKDEFKHSWKWPGDKTATCHLNGIGVIPRKRHRSSSLKSLSLYELTVRGVR